MKKISVKKVLVSLSLLMFIGCGAAYGTKEDKVKLTKEELKVAGNDKKKMLESLLSKASYKEAFTSAKNNPEIKEKLDSLEREIVNDYYILYMAGQNVKVTEEEIVKIYDENKADLEGKKLEEVRGAIEELIGRAKLSQEVVKTITEIKDKYKIGEGLTDEEIQKQKQDLDLKLSKAIYKEANENLKTKEQKSEMTLLKRRAVNDYYILEEAKKNINITNEEIEKIYEENKKDLEGRTLEEVSEAIERLIYENKLRTEVTNVLRRVNDKYGIDKLVEGYVSESSKK